ncbi:uncharacterized protein LOC113350732 [Papaver somniferum]|uniref:uncharacterized protein LOC113350732 n=1 Tax=Papaver somniferum TaxID=3469 RepID=UPI000E6F910B|nr:uncharacterized protein LOC113350732 [Papaver somniferum]
MRFTLKFFLRYSLTGILPNTRPDLFKVKFKIKKMAHDCECRMKGTMWGSDYEVLILQYFLIQRRKLKQPRIIELFFYLPSNEEILLCCDGASRGNPGITRYGFVVRNQCGDFVFAESGGLGVTANYIAEFIASIRALEWATEHQRYKIILQSDSKACIHSLMQQKIPWFLLARWQRVQAKILSISCRHAYMEVNFSADHFAKKGVYLLKGQTITYEDRPSSLTIMEYPDQPCYRFK